MLTENEILLEINLLLSDIHITSRYYDPVYKGLLSHFKTNYIESDLELKLVESVIKDYLSSYNFQK